jgi:Domain of unknown function (DUF5668)
MNRYIFLHRIKGPVMLLVFGVTALLDQWDVLSYGKSWPLYLIAFGVLQLAERAAWSQMQYEQPSAGQPGNWGTVGPPPPPPPTTPADRPRGFGSEDEGRK